MAQRYEIGVTRGSDSAVIVYDVERTPGTWTGTLVAVRCDDAKLRRMLTDLVVRNPYRLSCVGGLFGDGRIHPEVALWSLVEAVERQDIVPGLRMSKRARKLLDSAIREPKWREHVWG